MKKVVVIGGGFAWIQLVRHLDPRLFDVLLIDRLNHHQFQPLFYQVATSQLEPTSISFPLRKLFRSRKNTRIRLADVIAVNPGKRSVSTTVGEFSYDILVIATGCRTNFFGNAELEKHAYGLKTTYDAIRIRNNILQNFESLLSACETEKEYLRNIVIVGAGPTGVELAGSFSEIRRKILPRDFSEGEVNRVRIILLEGGPDTLGSMSELARSSSRQYLDRMGVELKTGVFVTGYDGGTVVLSNGETILSRQVIWTAGVTGNLLPGLPAESAARGNRIRVDRFHRVEGCDGIYAVGDIAWMPTPKYPEGHPQVANVAINQARNLARNLKAGLTGREPEPYEYVNLGSMATIGKHKAIVDLPFWSFRGRLAWFVWMFLHLMLILSVRNKLIIFINWAWNYLSGDTSLRLILKDSDRTRGD